ncbi:hypothetical protein Scep_025273 [Stephania cephalantha]|uniref:RRM domain-containing protein n=1 Tax=Stephania cephalantha TaxID=152367 RepID=A0AAP0ERV4_9MAGN
MAEEGSGVEMEEQVDLDGDTYNEEMDDDAEESLEDNRGHRGQEENLDDEEEEPLQADEHGKDALVEAEEHNVPIESVENEEKETATESLSEEDKVKHAELLSLPPHGSEIFLGGIPRDVMEEELQDLCEPFGELAEVRLMKDKGTGESKGYAFIVFRSRDAAQKAIEVLHSKEFKGKTVRCSLSQAKHKLFIGNIPKSWRDEEFRAAIEKNGPGVENIDLVKDPQNPSRNRGFAFVEYYNNACADYARQKMSDPQFKLEGYTPTVSWADASRSGGDSAAAAQVKALYIRNLPDSATTEKLKEMFERHGEVTKVVLPPAKAGQSKRDFGFIHYAERSSALKAVKETEKYELDGKVLDVSLAKPQTEKKYDSSPYSYQPGMLPGFIPNPGYGYGGDPYGVFGGGYGASSFGQPMIYGRGPAPPGMQMVPMLLPDGRLGYVLQQPGAQAPPPPSRRNDRRNDRGSGSRRDNSAGSDGRRYRPY